MTDIKEAQGLEVVAYVIEKDQRRDTFRQLSFKKPAPTTDSKDQWQVTATLTDLGKAQAVIDQLRAANGDLQLHFDTLKADYEALKSAPVVMPERIIFPTMLRKMWSGGEVQAWLDEVARLNRSKTNEQ